MARASEKCWLNSSTTTTTTTTTMTLNNYVTAQETGLLYIYLSAYTLEFEQFLNSK